MTDIEDRRSFIIESASLLAGASFLGGCRHSTSETSTASMPPAPKEWPEVPVREPTLEFPEFTSFKQFSDFPSSELAQLTKGERPKNMWLADLHALVAIETMEACFSDTLPIKTVDAIKQEIDVLARVISGEILYQNARSGRELSLREKVQIISAVYYGSTHGEFTFTPLFNENSTPRIFERRNTNRLFDEVWSSRTGACEDLVCAYACIIDRLNQAGHELDLSAVTVPGHIFIRAKENTDLFYIDLNEEGQIYEHTEVLEKYKITGKPHLIPGPYTSVACSISNAGWIYHVHKGEDWGKIVDPIKAKAWTDLLEVAVICAPEDTFYRVKLADQLVKHGYQLEEADMETRLKKLLIPISEKYPQSREPEVLLARYYSSEFGGERKDKAIELLSDALSKPEPGEGDARSVAFFVKISDRSIRAELKSMQ